MTYEQLESLAAGYNDVAKHRAWIDFRHKLAELRQVIISELLRGTLDKFGETRDNEKRAVLLFLDRILAIPYTLQEEYEKLRKRKDEMEKRATNLGDMHDNDLWRPVGGPTATSGRP